MVPVSLFQMLFALVNPIQAALKFQQLARLDPDGPAARLFVALEDWLADGVPMPVGAAKDLLLGWQIRNATAAGRWRFLGGAVDPRPGRPPRRWSSAATRDTIAPPPLARPLGAARCRGPRRSRPRTGHVGMVVGSAARAQVWRPVADFLARIGDRRSEHRRLSPLPMCDERAGDAPGGDLSVAARDRQCDPPPRRVNT